MRKREAERTLKAAKKSMDSLASWSSAEYWSLRQQKGEAELELNDIQNEIEEGHGDSQSAKTSNVNYLKRKAELKEETKSAKRKCRRYEARERILEAAKTTDIISVRASYLELVITLLTKTSRSNQSSFVQELSSRYGARKIGPVKYVWSPVTGDWDVRSHTKAAHIYPLSLGQKSMTYTFGEDAKDEINRAQNGLFLPIAVEEAYDRYLLTIVPCEEETSPQEWKILVLDRGGLWNSPANFLGVGKHFGDLHQKRLEFQPGNSFRPRARYFYFQYVMAMLKIGRSKTAEKAGISGHMSELTTPALTKVWATQGRYLRENMIRAFIEGIGHDAPDVDEEMMKHAKENPSDGDMELKDMVETAKSLDVESEEEDSDDD